eukprot:4917186-Prymnesium_polylepis.1
MEAEATDARSRQLGELRAEHALQLAQMAEEQEDSSRRTWRRATRAQDAMLAFVPRVAHRTLLARCWFAWRGVVEEARARLTADAESAAVRAGLQGQLAEAKRTLEEVREAAAGQRSLRAELEEQLRVERAARQEGDSRLQQVEAALAAADDAQLQMVKERDVLLVRLADAAEVRTMEHAASIAAAQAIAVEAATATVGRDAALAVASQEAAVRMATSSQVEAARAEQAVEVAALSASLREVDAERTFAERAQHTVKMALTERVIEEEEALAK